jgi:hypothetical protein
VLGSIQSCVDMVIDGAVDMSATFVIHVDGSTSERHCLVQQLLRLLEVLLHHAAGIREVIA